MSDFKPDDVVADARQFLELCVSVNGSDRAMALDDLAFKAGDHWDPMAKRQREIDGRPCLTVNTIPSILHQVTNDNRQNRQSIHVHPVRDGASQEVAEIMEGMIRHIEYESNADAAYDTAVESAAGIGFGFMRLVSEYESESSFNQRLRILRVRNPFTVYIDPMATEADGSDMRYAIITSRMDRKLFKAQYPDAEATTQSIGAGIGDKANWFWQDDVRIAEFYRVEETPATLWLCDDGVARYDDDECPDGVAKVKERRSTRRKIMWYKLTGVEVLESAEIPCKWIPVFPVWGDEIDIDGRVMRSGIIRNAKDPARMYDYFMTAATEEVGLRSKTPYIMAEGQDEGYEDDWNRANNTNFASLKYRPVSLDGVLAPPPQRQPMADIPVGNLQMCAMARDNIKATTGIYDASLGARGNETSGKGIMARQRQGDIANLHYADNLARAIRHLGRCLVSYFPKVYDTERVERILGVDNQPKSITINQPNVEGKPDKRGRIAEILNDVRIGEYDVIVSSGPAYNTLRQEATDAMVSLAQSWPKLMDIAGDKVLGSMDWPGSEEIAERAKRTIPPQILGPQETEDDDGTPKVQTPKGPMSIEEAGQVIAQLDEAAQGMSQELGAIDKELERARISAAASVEVARINAESRGDDSELKGMVQLMIARMDAESAARKVAADAIVAIQKETPEMELTDGQD